jgi:hypothetical protein
MRKASAHTPPNYVIHEAPLLQKYIFTFKHLENLQNDFNLKYIPTTLFKSMTDL